MCWFDCLCLLLLVVVGDLTLVFLVFGYCCLFICLLVDCFALLCLLLWCLACLLRCVCGLLTGCFLVLVVSGFALLLVIWVFGLLLIVLWFRYNPCLLFGYFRSLFALLVGCFDCCIC